MTSEPSKSAIFEGLKLSYESFGEGDTALVLVHGWTCSKEQFRGQVPLYHKFRSLLIDLPGHCESDAPENVDYTTEFFARSIGAVLDQEGIQKVILIGHSNGGPVSSMTVRHYPDRVLGMVYIDLFFHLPHHCMTTTQRRDLAKKYSEMDWATMWTSYWKEKTPPEVIEAVNRVSMATPTHVRVSTTTTNSLPPAYRGDELYDIPALHITKDPTQEDLLWRRHFPQLQTEFWKEGYSHWLFMEDPERFNASVEAFLQTHGFFEN